MMMILKNNNNNNNCSRDTEGIIITICMCAYIYTFVILNLLRTVYTIIVNQTAPDRFPTRQLMVTRRIKGKLIARM